MSYDSNTFRLPDPNIDPQAPGFVSVGLSNVSPGTRSRLNTGGSISVSAGGDYWTFDISYPEMTVEEEGIISPILYGSLGMQDPIYVQLPQYINPKTGAWSLATSVQRAQGEISLGPKENQIIVPSWSSRGGDLSPGDMLKFTNSHKIYMVRSIAISSDTATISLHCPIVEREKIPTAGLYPNNIQFRVDLVQMSPLELTSRGVYEMVNLTFEENIL